MTGICLVGGLSMVGTATRTIIRTLALTMVLAALLGLGLYGLHRYAKPVHAQQQPLSAGATRGLVVGAFFAAEGRGDIDAAVAQFADNGVFALASATSACFRATPCTDPAAIRAAVEATIGKHTCRSLVEIDIAGAVVTGRLEIRDDDLRARGIERGIQSFLAVVSQSKIAYLTIVGDPDDPQTALNQAITAGTAQPANPPIPAPSTPCGAS